MLNCSRCDAPHFSFPILSQLNVTVSVCVCSDITQFIVHKVLLEKKRNEVLVQTSV